MVQGGRPRAHGWMGVARYELVVMAQLWWQVQGDKEQGHKGENANVPSMLQIGQEGAPGPGECAHLH